MEKDSVKDNNTKLEVLVIGGSAGSLSVVQRIVPLLKRDANQISVIVVFHRMQTDDNMLAEVLETKTDYTVKEAEDKDTIAQCTVYLAPADYHLLVEKDRSLALDGSEKINYSRPSIDVTFESAAEVYGPAMACMLLSGANADGVNGLIAARNAGAFIIIQDPTEAEVSFMPQEAVNRVTADLLFNESNLAHFSEILAGRRPQK